MGFSLLGHYFSLISFRRVWVWTFFFFFFWCMGVFFSSLPYFVLHVQFLARFKTPPPEKMERMNKDMRLELIYKTETDSQA